MRSHRGWFDSLRQSAHTLHARALLSLGTLGLLALVVEAGRKWF